MWLQLYERNKKIFKKIKKINKKVRSTCKYISYIFCPSLTSLDNFPSRLIA